MILERIRKNKPSQVIPYPTIPTFPKSEKPLLKEFVASLELAAGTCHNLEEGMTPEEFIRQLHPDAKVICSATDEVKGNRDIGKVTDPHELDDVDVGVVRAQFGVSENGMVYFSEKDLQITSLGFLSQHLVVLLDPSQLVRDMYDAYRRVGLEENNYGCFMMGPSATADIGAVLVIGAQGARSLAVLFKAH